MKAEQKICKKLYENKIDVSTYYRSDLFSKVYIGQRGEGVKYWQNSVDVLYGWPLVYASPFGRHTLSKSLSEAKKYCSVTTKPIWCDIFIFSIGYPVVTLGFGFKTYVSYRMRRRRQREVQKVNEYYYEFLREALPPGPVREEAFNPHPTSPCK